MVPLFIFITYGICLSLGNYIQDDYKAYHGKDTVYLGDTLISLTAETPGLCALFCNLNDGCGGFNFYYQCQSNCCELTGSNLGNTVSQHSGATFYQKAKCPADYTRRPGSNDCYKFVTRSYSHTSAAANCIQDGAYLTSVNSQEEQDWLLLNSALYWSGRTWLGGSDAASEGTWLWEDGQPFMFTHWNPGEPNGEDCTEMLPDHGRWYDQRCTTSRQSICKIKLV